MNATTLSPRTLANLRAASQPDSWRTLSDAASTELEARGLWDSEAWALTVAGNAALNAASATEPTVGEQAEAIASATGSRAATVRQETRLADGTIRVDSESTVRRAATIRPFDTVVIDGQRFGVSEDGVDRYAEVVSVEVTYASVVGPKLQVLTFLPDELVEVIPAD